MDKKHKQACRLEALAERFGVYFKAASLQLVLVTRPKRIPGNVALLNASISADFRKTLKEEEQPEHTPVPA